MALRYFECVKFLPLQYPLSAPAAIPVWLHISRLATLHHLQYTTRTAVYHTYNLTHRILPSHPSYEHFKPAN